MINSGTLRGNGITIDTRGQTLDNAGGSIVSDGDVTTHGLLRRKTALEMSNSGGVQPGRSDAGKPSCVTALEP